MNECSAFVCTMGDVYVLMAAAGFILWGASWLWARRTPERREDLRRQKYDRHTLSVAAYILDDAIRNEWLAARARRADSP